MLTIKQLIDNKEDAIKRLAIKGFTSTDIIEQIISLDDQRKKNQVLQDQTQASLNKISKEIGLLFKSGNVAEANKLKDQTSEIKDTIKSLDQKSVDIANNIQELLIQVPNIPHETVPLGNTEADNKEIRSGGNIPQLPDNALPHWEIADKFNLINFELGNKLTGAGFPVYINKGAKLQRALISYFLDKAIEKGYTEVLPPLMVNENSAYATGQLPDKEGQMYHMEEDNFYLIPTAEVPVTNLYRDVILNGSDFPIKNVAYTPCFRREAGSYGKDVRGLNRVHQFDKVEIVQIQHPNKSYSTLYEMVNHIESLVNELELPYRIVQLCGGDLSFHSALTYDFEVFAGAQEKWLEVSSVSNFESFQSNRLKLRFKEKGNKKTTLAHTLNGSALALPRIVAALLENNQTSEGIKIPKVLVPYTGFDIIN